MFNFGGAEQKTSFKRMQEGDRQMLKESSLLIENRLQKRQSDP